MNFFGNFGNSFSRQSCHTPSFTSSTPFNTGMGIPSPMSSVMAVIEPLYPKAEFGPFHPSAGPSYLATPPMEIPSLLPMRELGERLSFPGFSMGMKPEVAIAPAPVAPPVMPAMEKSVAPLPIQEVASTVSTDRSIEAATPKPSFWERTKDVLKDAGHFIGSGLTTVGDIVTGEEPIILPTGKDYLMADDIRQKAAPMEVKIGATSLALISDPTGVVGAAVKKLAVEGAKAVVEAITPGGPGGLTLATPNGATVTGALEAVPAAVGATEGIGVGTVTAAITGSDLPLSMSLKQEKTPGQREVGNTGSYEELRRGIGSGGFQDDKEVHHIIPQRYLKEHGIPTEDAPAVVLPKEVHKQTSTHGRKALDFDLDQSFRDATAEGVKDVIKVEKEHGIYESDGRENLIKEIGRAHV